MKWHRELCRCQSFVKFPGIMQIILNVSTGITLSLRTYALYGNRNVSPVGVRVILRNWKYGQTASYHTPPPTFTISRSCSRSGTSLDVKYGGKNFWSNQPMCSVFSGLLVTAYLSPCHLVRDIELYSKAVLKRTIGFSGCILTGNPAQYVLPPMFAKFEVCIHARSLLAATVSKLSDRKFHNLTSRKDLLRSGSDSWCFRCWSLSLRF